MAADKSTNWIIKLVDKVTAPIRAIQKSIKGATGDWARHTTEVGRAEKAYGGLGSTIRGLGLAAGITLLANNTIGFEHSMAMSNTIMKETPAHFAAVTDQVRELSKTIPIARDQLSKGLYETLSAGVPKENAIQFLNDSAKAAVAGQADLGEVIRTTTSIIKAYGFEFDKQAMIQDRMQKAVDLGQMTMGEFASALPHATVMAGNLGVGIDELMGAFATMSGVTGNASEVSTQLAAIMSGMVNPTAEAAEVIEKLGIAFDANSVKNAGGLSNYLTELMPKIDALSKRSGATRESLIAKLFGREEAVRGIIGLTGELANTWVSNTAQMAGAAGAVGSAFATMAETTQSKIDMLKNKFFAFWDKLWAMLAPILLAVINGLSGIMDAMMSFAQAHPTLMTTIGIIAGVSIGIWALYSAILWARGAWIGLMASMSTGIITKIVGLIVTLGAAILGVSAPMWAATSSTLALNAALWANPIVWIIAVIAALIGAIILMIKHWDDVKAWFVGLWNWFLDHSLFGWVVDLVQQHLPALKQAWNSLWDGMKLAMQPVIDAFKWVWDFIQKLWGGIKDLGAAIGKFLGLPENLDFRGYGQPADIYSGTAVDAEAAGPAYTPLVAGGASTDSLKVNGSFANSNAAGMEASGGTKGAAIINFKNEFKITLSGVDGDLKEVATRVAGYISDQLSDAAITASR